MASDKRISELADAGPITGPELVEIVQGGINVKTTTAALGATATGVEHYRGQFDASGGGLPTNGNGTAGVPLAGDYWVTSVAGTIFGISVEVKQRFGAIITDPQDADDIWYS